MVPQTSTHFPMSAEFDLECFRREMVGMTTSARLMESAGITSTPRRLQQPGVRSPYVGSSTEVVAAARCFSVTKTISNLALRRCAIHGADEQVVQRYPLRGAQGAEEIVLENAEPAVGQTELVLAVG